MTTHLPSQVLLVSQNFEDFNLHANDDASFAFLKSQNSAETLEFLKKLPISTLVIHQNLVGALDLLNDCRQNFPTVPRIFVADSTPSREVVEKVVNSGRVSACLENVTSEKLMECLRKTTDQFKRTLAQRNLVREAALKNRQLEELTQNLERVVGERTSRIRESKIEAENKQKEIRKLVHFIGDLNRVSDLEELLNLLTQQLRTMNLVGQVMLGYVDENQAHHLFFSEGSKVVSKISPRPWSHGSEVQFNSKDLQQLLADIIGRPFVKVLSLPLRSRMSPDMPPSVLFVEHSFGDEEVLAFIDYVLERIQPLGIALDRLLLSLRLEDTSEQWAQTFDAINEPIHIIDMDYNLLRANHHFAEDYEHLKCFQVFLGRNVPCDGCPVRLALKTHQSQIGEVRKDNGKRNRIYQVHAYPIKLLHDQHATTVINHYIDVTEDKNLYSRTIQNEKMAAIGVMAGHIAHELNNPLTGLRAMAQILKKELPDAALQGDLIEVESAAERSQHIIKNLLEFSKQNEQEGNKVCSLNEIVQRTLPMLKAAIRQHGSDVELSAEERPIRGNPQLIQQLIFNLVNNACQAMKTPGKVKIWTYLRDGHMCVSVADTGPGIPVSIQHRIFEAFFTTKPEGQGTGLGLSIGKSIVEKIGGYLKLESTGPAGTVFTAAIPVEAN